MPKRSTKRSRSPKPRSRSPVAKRRKRSPKKAGSKRKTRITGCTGKERNWERWDKSSAKPSSYDQRQKSYDKCGAECFGDAKGLSYPWCNKGSCTLNRAALMSAKIRSVTHGRPSVGAKAARMVKRCKK